MYVHVSWECECKCGRPGRKLRVIIKQLRRHMRGQKGSISSGVDVSLMTKAPSGSHNRSQLAFLLLPDCTDENGVSAEQLLFDVHHEESTPWTTSSIVNALCVFSCIFVSSWLFLVIRLLFECDAPAACPSCPLVFFPRATVVHTGAPTSAAVHTTGSPSIRLLQ